MVSNPSDKVKCVACETPKPNSAETQKVNLIDSAKSTPSITKPDDLMAKFMKKPAGWSCDVCMISNSADKTKCAACETPKPGTKGNGTSNEPEVTNPTINFGTNGGFKFAADNTATKCDSAAGFKFGSTDNSTKTESAGCFKFGTTDASSKIESSG